MASALLHGSQHLVFFPREPLPAARKHRSRTARAGGENRSEETGRSGQAETLEMTQHLVLNMGGDQWIEEGAAWVPQSLHDWSPAVCGQQLRSCTRSKWRHRRWTGRPPHEPQPTADAHTAAGAAACGTARAAHGSGGLRVESSEDQLEREKVFRCEASGARSLYIPAGSGVTWAHAYLSISPREICLVLS